MEMENLSTFKINFNNRSGAFYPGDTIYGTINIEVLKSMRIRGLLLRFEGKAHVFWTEDQMVSSGKKTSVNVIPNTGEEEFFDEELLLFGIRSCYMTETVKLRKGGHVFPFSFQLPYKLPSSFKDDSGSILYEVHCRITQPNQGDITIGKIFTVLGILDLNSHEECSVPLSAKGKKSLCCFCCRSGPITASIDVDRKGWVPGEEINVNVQIINESNRKMIKSFLNLKMVVTYNGNKKSKKEFKEVASLVSNAIEKHSEDIWTNEKMLIPPVPPTSNGHIIQVSYILQLNITPPFGMDLRVPLDVVIGTVPLKSAVGQIPLSSIMVLRPSTSIVLKKSFTSMNHPQSAEIPGIEGGKNYTPMDLNECDASFLEYTPVYCYFDFTKISTDKGKESTTEDGTIPHSNSKEQPANDINNEELSVGSVI